MPVPEFTPPMNELLDTALRWHSRGYTPLPCRPRSKVAAVRWQEWQSQQPPESLVQRWFTSGDHNLAVMCGGLNNLVVVDFDSQPHAFAWFYNHDNIETFTVRTARGCHIYFEVVKPPEQTFAMADGAGEVKYSGYICAPPSTHPTGVPYVVAWDKPILRIDSLTDIGIRPVESLPRIEGVNAGVDRNADDPIIRGCSCKTRLYHGVISDVKHRLSMFELVNQYTTLKTSDSNGRWFMARCPHPGHLDRHPSFRVDAIFNQATCLTPTCRLNEPRGMDVIELYARLYQLSNRQSMTHLALELELLDAT